MAVQERSSTRNYIDLVEARGDDGRNGDVPATSVRPIRDYLMGLVAAMRSARSDAR